MSNYHVLEINAKKDTARIVFHIAVPSENNVVGVNLRTALKQQMESQSESGSIETLVPWDIGTEITDLQSGAVYEHIESVEYDANANNAAKQAAIDNRYNMLASNIPNRIREKFKFWGLNRDVT